MRKVHFYKAKSRLGIINPPINQKDLNLGVENAPDVILTEKFLSKFDSYTSEFVFSKPEKIKDQSNINERYFNVLANELQAFKGLINASLKPGEMQVVIGGDNSVTFSSLLALLERVRDANKIGYIQFDSHGEMNLYKTSPTKNFHGMYLRPFIDSFDIPKISSIVHFKLPLQNILFIGDIKLDSQERIYFEKAKLRNISRDEVLRHKNSTIKELEDFICRFDYLHVNFDVDVFNHKEAMATGIPSSQGFMLYELLPLLEIVSKHPNLSLDLSEVNPQKEDRDKTIKIAQKVLSIMLRD